MTGFVIFVVLVTLAVWLLWKVGLLDALLGGWQNEVRRQRLLDELHRHDHEVLDGTPPRRQAMNDAAGQSWRNRFE